MERCPRCDDLAPGRYCPTCGLDRTPDAPLLGIQDAREARQREAEWEARAVPEEEPVRIATADPVLPMDVVAEPGGVFPLVGGACQRCGATGQAGEWYCTECGLRLQPGRFSLAREAAARTDAWSARHPDTAVAWEAGVAVAEERRLTAPDDPEPVREDRAAGEPEHGQTKTCPECAEQVQAAALVCRYCRHRFDAPSGGGGWSAAAIGTPAYPATTSTAAIAAFVCSLLGIWIVGLPLGIYAQREIDESNGQLTGRGLATVAVVLGILGLIVTVFAVGAILSASSDYESYP